MGCPHYMSLIWWGKPPVDSSRFSSHVLPQDYGMHAPNQAHGRASRIPWTTWLPPPSWVWIKNCSTYLRTWQEMPLSEPRQSEENYDRCSKRLRWEVAGFLRPWGNKSRYLPPSQSLSALIGSYPQKPTQMSKSPLIFNIITRVY